MLLNTYIKGLEGKRRLKEILHFQMLLIFHVINLSLIIPLIKTMLNLSLCWEADVFSLSGVFLFYSNLQLVTVLQN